MKKSLKYTIICIAAILVGAFIYQTSTQNKQTNQKLPQIGVLQFVSHPSLDLIYKGFVEELEKEGYKDKETVILNYQNAQADQSKLSTMSQQLISQKPDILVGIATPAAQALANQTKDIPIILGAISDPVGAGLVQSKEKPGGNITGVSHQSPVKEQIDLIKTILPKAKTIGIIYCSAEDNSLYQVEQFKKAVGNQFNIKTYAVPSTNEIAKMSEVMVSEVDGVYIPTDNIIANGFQTLVGIADKAKIPLFPSVDTMVDEGGLATVGIDQYQLGVKTAQMTIDVLKGKAKPADTPVYTYTKGTLIVNEEKAKQLGISIPNELIEEAKK